MKNQKWLQYKPTLDSSVVDLQQSHRNSELRVIKTHLAMAMNNEDAARREEAAPKDHRQAFEYRWIWPVRFPMSAIRIVRE